MPTIGGGAPRSYLLVLPSTPSTAQGDVATGATGGATSAAPQGICLLARGTQEEGARVVLSGRRLAPRLGQAVRFDKTSQPKRCANCAPR